MGFSGQVALVTGGTRGIGAAITRRLLAEGAAVGAVYAGNDEAANAMAAAVAADGLPGTLSLHRADIGDPDACRAVVADVVAPMVASITSSTTPASWSRTRSAR